MQNLRFKMFLRLVLRGITLRRGRTLTALLAMMIAAAIATSLLNLYVDLDSKLNKEFSKFGANVVIVPKNGLSLSVEDIQSHLLPSELSVPFAYAIAKTSSGRPIVVVGTDFDQARQLNAGWSVTENGSRATGVQATIGVRAQEALQAEETPDTLIFTGNPIHFVPTRIVHTGGAEDSRIFLPIKDFANWTKAPVSSVELFIPGNPQVVTSRITELQRQLPFAEVRPIRQIVEAETRVLGKTRSMLLASTTLIVLLVALCVLATLTASILEGRKDYAVMKALGSTQGKVRAIFLIESLSISLAGALIGFVVGSGIAAWIGRTNFHAAVVPRMTVLPVVLFGSIAVSFLSALIPLATLNRIQPAVMLRGE